MVGWLVGWMSRKSPEEEGGGPNVRLYRTDPVLGASHASITPLRFTAWKTSH